MRAGWYDATQITAIRSSRAQFGMVLFQGTNSYLGGRQAPRALSGRSTHRSTRSFAANREIDARSGCRSC